MSTIIGENNCQKMKEVNNHLDPNELINNLKADNLGEVVRAVKSGSIDKDAIEKINNDFDELLLEACKTKISLEIRFLYEGSPQTTLRDVVIKMLNLLPVDIEAVQIPILTKYIIEKWTSNQSNLAA